MRTTALCGSCTDAPLERRWFASSFPDSGRARGGGFAKHHASTSHGFTLLEVLVAFVIASLALALIFQASVGSMRAVGTAARYEEAISRARSHMDAASLRLAAGDQQGDDGRGFRWHTRMRPVDAFEFRNDGGAGAQAAYGQRGSTSVTLYAVTVWISWADGGRKRELRLDTTRLGSGKPPS